ncbi:D-arabinono-1,4-lactone oxidase [Mycobacterium lepromatosis]|uniref:D-arabinono-1,4-lactone oxidase n=1 Tax=Mycobacterium lepromatosis TaxID=480418 RepID=UPI002351E952|nr:D-arabinono-1,4-lactone oxidase [Mycobacterium lepromatosis]
MTIQRIVDLVCHRNLPIMFLLEVRFAASDDAFTILLRTGVTAGYVAVHQYTMMELETYFRSIEAIMDDYAE